MENMLFADEEQNVAQIDSVWTLAHIYAPPLLIASERNVATRPAGGAMWVRLPLT